MLTATDIDRIMRFDANDSALEIPLMLEEDIVIIEDDADPILEYQEMYDCCDLEITHTETNGLL